MKNYSCCWQIRLAKQHTQTPPVEPCLTPPFQINEYQL